MSTNSKPLPIEVTTAGEEILTCHQADITITLPKPITSGIEAKGRFGKQDFVYLSDEGYVPLSCRREARLPLHQWRRTVLVLRRYWTNTCQSCAIKRRCTTGKERRITRWEHEHLGRPDVSRKLKKTIVVPITAEAAKNRKTELMSETLRIRPTIGGPTIEPMRSHMPANPVPNALILADRSAQC